MSKLVLIIFSVSATNGMNHLNKSMKQADKDAGFLKIVEYLKCYSKLVDYITLNFITPPLLL
jgi:hypothetical protein